MLPRLLLFRVIGKPSRLRWLRPDRRWWGLVAPLDFAPLEWHALPMKTAHYGSIHRYQTGEEIRPATAAELISSLEASIHDGGPGAYQDPKTGVVVYVDGERIAPAIEELSREAATAGDRETVEQCEKALQGCEAMIIECIRVIDNANAMIERGASRCDQCGELASHIDVGFSPGLHAMRHDCGGTWRVAK